MRLQVVQILVTLFNIQGSLQLQVQLFETTPLTQLLLEIPQVLQLDVSDDPEIAGPVQNPLHLQEEQVEELLDPLPLHIKSSASEVLHIVQLGKGAEVFNANGVLQVQLQEGKVAFPLAQ